MRYLDNFYQETGLSASDTEVSEPVHPIERSGKILQTHRAKL